jgi:Enolase
MQKNPQIDKVRTLEVLDSRGNPTIQVEITTKGGAKGMAIVPSGASTGSHEALELRDEDKKRFAGKGILKAQKIVEKKIFPLIKGMDVRKQHEIDCLMINEDKTPNKSRFGANAILGVSLACARAGAMTEGLPLFRYLQEVYSFKRSKRTPIPMCNLVNGGRHSDSRLDIQEFMIVPSGITKSFAEKMRAVSEVYSALGKILKEKGYSVAVGDEGGYAARLPHNRTALEFMALAIKKAGYKLGKDVSLGIDAAASEFFRKSSKKYRLEKQKKSLTIEEMVALYRDWAKNILWSS